MHSPVAAKRPKLAASRPPVVIGERAVLARNLPGRPRFGKGTCRTIAAVSEKRARMIPIMMATPMRQGQTSKELFYSYSHKDAELRDELDAISVSSCDPG
jgi:hypothetical protein